MVKIMKLEHLMDVHWGFFFMLPYVNVAYIRVQVDLVYKSTSDRLYVSISQW